MDKRDRAQLFRQRLFEAMQVAEETRSGLARRVGVDRSTISQLLVGDTARLPNAHVVAECASALGVAGDWLLGRSDFPERTSDVLANSMQVSKAARTPFDAQIFDWRGEAAGYKIRHVPATVPDILKTEELLRWEFSPHRDRTTDQAIGASNDQLDWARQSLSDYEIAMPLFSIESLANSTEYYRGLPQSIRQGQIDHMLALHDQLYPSLRVFLFDARRLWSSALTIFGPLVGVLYLGQQYFAFRDRERVRNLTDHFDGLVREATVSSRDWPDHLKDIAT